jgi:hypothetical protein
MWNKGQDVKEGFHAFAGIAVLDSLPQLTADHFAAMAFRP